MNLKKVIPAAFMAIASMGAQGQTPDSCYIYLWGAENGSSGLRAEIADERPNVKRGYDPGFRLTGSDFGAWGAQKKMFNPTVYRDTETGGWHLVFNPDREGTLGAYTYSPDLIKWTVQEYDTAQGIMKRIPKNALPGEALSIEDHKGSMFKVARSTADKLTSRARFLQERDAASNQRASEDLFRFAGIDTVEMTLTLRPEEKKRISDRFIGIFFEDINYAADGGLYSELIQNRDFEYNPADRGNDQNWHALRYWSLSDSTGSTATINTTSPIHANNAHYVTLESRNGRQSLVNRGFDGVPVEKGYIYNVSLWLKTASATPVKVALLDEAGKEIGSTKLSGNHPGEWTQLNGSIKANATTHKGRLAVTPLKGGTHDLDMISLMPANTFNGRQNGLRQDLAQALADLKPRFVRFPGGCVAHGDGVDNIYDWKGSIGRLEERRGMRNLWGYHQTRGLGYHEYFLMCEDFGAEPLPVLAAGVPCQNSSTAAHHTHDALTRHGQQQGIPMEEMEAYIQDIKDLIEYANGDTTTTWGRKRAQAGHPAPFNLKMIGIGNEDLISEAFIERFKMIFESLKKSNPEIEVVGTVGPFYEGADYEKGWELARELDIPVVDEHYYVSPGWLIHNGDYYDRYSRQGTKVYLGEYASHLPDRASSLEAALSNALYLTNVERNADVVTMTSYAPLLANERHTQWRPDLIYFNNHEVKLTPDYFVQKMYGNNAGTLYVPTSRTVSNNNPELLARLGQSIVIDETTGDTIVRLVNMTPTLVSTKLDINGPATLTLLTGNPDDRDSREMTSEINVPGQYTQPPYSFSVLRFKK